MPTQKSPSPERAHDGPERRAQKRVQDEKWRTALTCIEPNKILVRGYPLDEMMGRLTFGEAIYLLLMGEIPSPGIGSLMEAVLISFIDHGATPPSTLAARNTATTGAPLRSCIASGILGFGRYHGGDIESCMQFLDSGLELVRGGVSYRDAAEQIVQNFRDHDGGLPGFGHRFHTRDPRAARLFQMALELEAEGEHIQMIRQVEMVVAQSDHPLPVNIDGAIAAHAREEFERHAPMRQIDPKDHVYDGPTQRRLPERRK
jgi:citrate synthase